MANSSASLQVLICPDGDQWFAQGVDVNYAACGDSVEDVQRRFETGFLLTSMEHLKRGTLESFIQQTPQHVMDRLDCDSEMYTLVLRRPIKAKARIEGLPFKQFAFLTAPKPHIEAT